MPASAARSARGSDPSRRGPRGAGDLAAHDAEETANSRPGRGGPLASKPV